MTSIRKSLLESSDCVLLLEAVEATFKNAKYNASIKYNEVQTTRRGINGWGRSNTDMHNLGMIFTTGTRKKVNQDCNLLLTLKDE